MKRLVLVAVPETARYYLTVANFMGERRFGRKEYRRRAVRS